MKTTLSNTGKHARYGALTGYFGLIALLLPAMAVFIAIGIAAIYWSWENAQYLGRKKAWWEKSADWRHLQALEPKDEQWKVAYKLAYKAEMKRFRKQYNWLDAIADWCAGYAAFSVCYWLIITIGR